MDTELVKMSPKGQLVVPQNIRELERFKPGDRFISFPIKEGILFKKVKIQRELVFTSAQLPFSI